MSDKRRTPQPIDPGLEEIERWRIELLTAEEEFVRSYPDRHLVDGHRAQVTAIANAHAAELRAAYLARSAQR
jgi:hypothetical protein